jgi:hypothetical protein
LWHPIEDATSAASLLRHTPLCTIPSCRRRPRPIRLTHSWLRCTCRRALDNAQTDSTWRFATATWETCPCAMNCPPPATGHARVHFVHSTRSYRHARTAVNTTRQTLSALPTGVGSIVVVNYCSSTNSTLESAKCILGVCVWHVDLDWLIARRSSIRRVRVCGLLPLIPETHAIIRILKLEVQFATRAAADE